MNFCHQNALESYWFRIVLVDVNMNGIQDGYAPLCQVNKDDEPGEVVERVYVQDLLDKYDIIY